MSSTCPERPGAGQGTRIVAHRGASGYLPEHTTVSKVLAYGQGADLLEQDVVATRDHALVVLHDLWLDDVTDVSARFPDRRRADGRCYVADCTRSELGELRLSERRRPGRRELAYPGRFAVASAEFTVAGLEDEIRLIAGMNSTTGRRVGIYPEIKEPAWHQAHGIDLTRLVHEALLRCRELLTGPVFVQCFDRQALLRLREEFAAPWPLVQLLDRERADALAANRLSLRETARLVAAVGLPYTTLMVRENGRVVASRLARTLVDEGLALHPYTLRRDVPPPGGISYRDALRFLIEDLAVDALFCDFPDDAVAIRDCSAA